MSGPLIYILAPFALAFALFALFLVVSLFLKDPTRPFRMFGAPPLEESAEYNVQGVEENEEEEKDECTVNREQ